MVFGKEGGSENAGDGKWNGREKIRISNVWKWKSEEQSI